jgi:hypothetical protein
VIPRYPLSVSDQRRLPADYGGPAFVWDVDKTYLATRFSSMKHLARIPLELAVDKHAIAGMPEVLRGLRRGPGPAFACAPIYFVSASPPQLRKVLEKKMLLDGVEHDGITLKDWAQAVRGMRPGRLREQIGFKLAALLTGRVARPLATEYLFGDDVEHDATAYSLYARLLGDPAPGPAIERELREAGVAEDDVRCVFRLCRDLPQRVGGVGRVFIHLEAGHPPEQVAAHGPLVTPVRGAFQLALALLELGLVDRRTVTEAAAALRSVSPLRPPDLEDLLADAVGRGLVRGETARAAVA